MNTGVNCTGPLTPRFKAQVHLYVDFKNLCVRGPLQVKPLLFEGLIFSIFVFLIHGWKSKYVEGQLKLYMDF